MKDRTMIVRFISLGPADSIFTILGLQCTDSWYVAHSEDLLYRPGYEQFVKAGPKSDFLRVVHSAGKLSGEHSQHRARKEAYLHRQYGQHNLQRQHTIRWKLCGF